MAEHATGAESWAVDRFTPRRNVIGVVAEQDEILEALVFETKSSNPCDAGRGAACTMYSLPDERTEAAKQDAVAIAAPRQPL
jgi:hypothetical protein